MSGGLKQAVRVNLLGLLFTPSAYTTPTSPIKVELSTATTSDTSNGTLVSGGSYAAQSFGAGSASAANPSVISNSSTINFTGMPVATVTDVLIRDSASTPVYEAWGPLSASKTTASGDTLQFASTALAVQL